MASSDDLTLGRGLNGCEGKGEHKGTFSSWSMTYGSDLIDRRLVSGQFEAQFMGLSSEIERVALILREPRLLEIIDEMIGHSNNSPDEDQLTLKSHDISSKSRKAGNDFFKANNMAEALMSYNEAILWSPHNVDSDGLSLSFANRSAVFCKLNRFEESLLDIDQALKRNYPLEKVPKLLIRKLKCYKSLGNEVEAEIALKAITELMNKTMDEQLKQRLAKDIESFEDVGENSQQQNLTFDLTLKEPNGQLFGANKSIHMGYDPEKGRTIEATRDIEEGEVILIERPFVCWLDPTYYSEYCHHCLNQLDGRPLPCSRCPLVRFCSTQCADESWRQYHRIECPLIPSLGPHSLTQMALRVCIIYGAQELIKCKQRPKIAASDWPKEQFQHELNSILSLFGSNISGYREMFGVSFAASVLVHLADKLSLVEPQNKPLLGSCLVDLMLRIDLNKIAIYQQLKCSKFSGIFQEKEGAHKVYGSALYGTASLLNHSCSFNAKGQHLDGSRLVIASCQNIVRGEEVTITYWAKVRLEVSYSDRQEYFRQNFGFTCHCSDCLNRVERPAFRCPRTGCGGNLVINFDQTNYCANCGEKNIPLDGVMSSLSLAKTCLEEGSGFLNKGCLEEAEACLLEGQSLVSQVFHPQYHERIVVKELLSDCFEAKRDFDEAIKYRLEAAHLAKIRWRDNSFQVLSYLLQVVDLYAEKGRETREGKEKDKCIASAKTFFGECSARFSRIMSMEFKTISGEHLDTVIKFQSMQKTLLK